MEAQHPAYPDKKIQEYTELSNEHFTNEPIQQLAKTLFLNYINI